MAAILVTLETFHPPISLLNAGALSNILFILVTLETSHLEIFELKVVLSLNN